MLAERWFGPDARRRRLQRKTAPGALRDYLSVPFPSPGNALGGTRFVALDLETSGLDPRRDEILSIGSVEMRFDRIDLSTAQRQFAAPSGALAEASVVIHQITDDRAAAGWPLERLLPPLLARLAGCVLVAHHAEVERRFLDAACRRVYGSGFCIRVVDTEALFRRQIERRQQGRAPGDLRLAALRERLGLPPYRAHDALSDALAAGELLLAYAAEAGFASGTPLGRLLTD
jgi:DNA polymerase III subunit epsilon